jgi:hypothetical protein
LIEWAKIISNSFPYKLNPTSQYKLSKKLLYNRYIYKGHTTRIVPSYSIYKKYFFKERNHMQDVLYIVNGAESYS